MKISTLFNAVEAQLLPFKVLFNKVEAQLSPFKAIIAGSILVLLITTTLGAAPVVMSQMDSLDNSWNRLYLEVKNPDPVSFDLADHSIEYYMYEPGMDISSLMYEVWDNGGENREIHVSFAEIIPAYVDGEKRADIICRITLDGPGILAPGETIHIAIGIRHDTWQQFTDYDDWSYHNNPVFDENPDILLIDSTNRLIAGNVPPFITVPWKGTPVYWLGQKTNEEIGELEPREGDVYQSTESGINYIYFGENWQAISRSPQSKTTTFPGGISDPTWEISNKNGDLVFENFGTENPGIGLPGIIINPSGDVTVNRSITGESGVFNTSIFLGQDTSMAPAAPFHIQNINTDCFLDTNFAAAIIEGFDGRLQLAATNEGTHGASILLTNYKDEQESRTWLLSHKTMNTFDPEDPLSYSSRLSFNFGTLGPDGFDIEEVMSVGAARTKGAILDLNRVTVSAWPRGPSTAIRVSKLRSTDHEESVYALRTEDTNQFIWSPLDGNTTDSGIYFAANSDAVWQSGVNPYNPNEIVFVGWGEKKASVSLRDGRASFKSGIFIGDETGASPAAPFHIQNTRTGCFLDTNFADAIIEGYDGRLQLAATNEGTHGASILLTNYKNEQESRTWLLSHKTMNTPDPDDPLSYSSRLSFNFGTLGSDGLDIKEVMSVGAARTTGAILDLNRVTVSAWPRGPSTAIRVSKLRSTDPEEHVYALRTEDTNQFIWSPLDGNTTDSGIYFASDEDAEWQSGNYPDNPNEIVFVGWGKKKASISLRNGNAFFNRVSTSEIILDQDYWADHVFEEDYEMMELKEVEGFIEENGHLPGIPSAEEVVKNGVSIGESQVKLLEKIEELTLYMIEQQKEITSLKAELKEMKNMFAGKGDSNE
jgi:hypothetical protein